jgi:adenosylhomocysteinase
MARTSPTITGTEPAVSQPASARPPSDIADPGLAEAGNARIDWARRAMPVLGLIGERFAAQQPLRGLTVAACLHVTAETAVLIRTLRAGGARVLLAASNPLSTQDDTAAALAGGEGSGGAAGRNGGAAGGAEDRGGPDGSGGISVFARAGVDRATYYAHIARAVEPGPDLVIDDGGDLVNTLHAERPDLLAKVRGGCESTTTGVIRLRRMAAAGALAFPVVAANDTPARRMVDNTCGTGQSVVDGILRATNTLLAGKTVVVAGFGACGQGIASRVRGLGGQVIVTETDPVRALDAVLRGFRVLPMLAAASLGEMFVTATGSRDVITAEHMARMGDGTLLANAGHFDVEIDVRALARLAAEVRRDVRPHTDEYILAGGRRLLLLAEGRVVNLVAGEGHPAAVMDLSFGIQALALAWLASAAAPLPGVHEVPPSIDAEVARLQLASAGTEIDTLTPEQRDYLASWHQGS